MASPGWYPDPDDPGWHQYYDGHRWTGNRLPTNAPSPQTAPLPSYQPQHGQPPQPWEQAPQPWGQPPPRRRSRVPWIVGLVAVLAAGLSVGGYLVFRGSSSPTFTFDGKAIDSPNKPLQQTDAVVRSLVSSRHGAQSQDTRCYYAVPTQQVPGVNKSDIDDSIWCGPVLFIDGDPGKQYLRFPLNSELAAPAPPAAGTNALLATDVGTATVPAAPPGAVIGSSNGGITLTKLGTVKRYGTGDAARRAPTGSALIAFRLGGAMGDGGVPADLSSNATVSINGGAGRKLPNADSDQYLVIAVPNSARSVDLVLNDAGHKQTLSLLSGKPGAGNIEVLARTHRQSDVRKTGSVHFTFSQTVGFPDGSSGTRQAGTYTVDGATLAFSLPGKHVKASSTSEALLYVDVGYTVPQSPGRNFGFQPETMTFTPKGGAPIKARNVATSADMIYDIFEVPADLTSGTLHIAGSFTTKFVNSSSSYITTVTTPIAVPVTFPAG